MVDLKDIPFELEKNWVENPPHPQKQPLQLSLIPLPEILSLRNRLKEDNILFPKHSVDLEAFSILDKDPVYSILKSKITLNPFMMEAASIDFIKKTILTIKPRNIIELGSGLSTAILSYALKEAYKDSSEKPVYLSIDQSQEYLDITYDYCKEVGTQDVVKTMCFPVCHVKTPEMCHQGQDVFPTYAFEEQKIYDALSGVKADMVIIDGPTQGGDSGYGYARFMTVAFCRHYASKNAVFFLDDAYRDAELTEIVRWQNLGFLKVGGIKAVGKGLMVGLKP